MNKTIRETKGPAEAATSPSHCSDNPHTGNEQNMCADSTDSIEREPLHGKPSIQIDLNALDQMGVRLLKSLYSDIRTLNNVLSGMLNRPCHQASERIYELNIAGGLLDDLHEFLSVYEQAIINATRASKPTEALEVHDRACLLLKYEAGCDETLLGIATMAMNFAKQEAEAATPNRRAAA
ncbi:hypothetical protein ACLIR7_03790 [Nitratireductor aquimarinus]|uniref:hypothetical protein n=1 Tax=Nitratireductor aquimarinus TaxID=889300 RepID=UPI00398EE56D